MLNWWLVINCLRLKILFTSHYLISSHWIWILIKEFSFVNILINWTLIEILLQLLVIQRVLIINIPKLLYILFFIKNPRSLFIWNITLRGSDFIKLLLSRIKRLSGLVNFTAQWRINFISIICHSTSSYIIIQSCLL
jgi:hypothetical protein